MNYIKTIILAFYSLTLFSCANNNPINQDALFWHTSFEDNQTINGITNFTDGQGFITGSNNTCDTTSKSGKKSFFIKKNEKYGLKAIINSIKPGDFYLAKIWVKTKGKLPKLVAELEFERHATHSPIKQEKGWQLLELRFNAKTESNSAKFYIYAPDSETVFIDDFKILKLPSKPKKNIDNTAQLEEFHIQIKDENDSKLKKLRKKAYKQGLQNSTTKKWIKANINDDEVKLRYKGDWLDHLSNYKWSFRVKPKQSPQNQFSITNPISRNFLKEYINQRIMESEGIKTTNYRFCFVSINDKKQGIYGLEDHFSNSKMHTWKKDSGLIFKYDEDDLWAVRFENKLKNRHELNHFDCAKIQSYNNIKDNNQFISHGKALDQMKRAEFQADSIYDLNYMAKYLALIDLFNGYHGTIWHNLRFFKSFKTGKYYPIAFDLSTEGEHGNEKLMIQRANGIPLFIPLFQNNEFKSLYIKNLQYYSSKEFIATIPNILGDEYELLKTAMLNEYNSEWVQTDFIVNRADFINQTLTKEFINNFKNKIYTVFQAKNSDKDYEFNLKTSVKVYNQGNNTFLVMNYFNKSVEVTGFLNQENKLLKVTKTNLEPFQKKHSKTPHTYFKLKTEANKCIVNINGKQYHLKISSSPYPISY